MIIPAEPKQCGGFFLVSLYKDHALQYYDVDDVATLFGELPVGDLTQLWKFMASPIYGGFNVL